MKTTTIYVKGTMIRDTFTVIAESEMALKLLSGSAKYAKPIWVPKSAITNNEWQPWFMKKINNDRRLGFALGFRA